MAKNNIYAPKSLVEGYKIGVKYSGKTMVAVPQKKAEAGCIIAFGNKIMRTVGKEPLERISFTDKYGRGSYFLYYYEWIPEKIW
jgi:hypothetical protein